MTRLRLDGATGETGLAVAIIATAAKDVTGRDPELVADARAFFVSPWYHDLLAYLDFEGWQLPDFAGLRGDNDGR